MVLSFSGPSAPMRLFVSRVCGALGAYSPDPETLRRVCEELGRELSSWETRSP